VDRILAFGDSLTEGESSGVFAPVFLPSLHDPSTPGVATSYPARLQALVTARYTEQSVTIFNGGRGGELASEGLSRMVDLIGLLAPQVVIIMTGVNDLNGGASITATADAVDDLVRTAQDRGLTVLLSTIPRQVESGRRAFSPDEVVPFNETLARVADRRGATLVDIYPQLTDEYITPDGLHITPAGNELLAAIYLEAIKAKFEEGTPPAFSRRP
jgi:lysophospholipase L1-like esterase